MLPPDLERLARWIIVDRWVNALGKTARLYLHARLGDATAQAELNQRLGVISADEVESVRGDSGTLWFYACSRGDISAAIPIVKATRMALPESKIVFSFQRDADLKGMNRLMPEADAVFYHPLRLGHQSGARYATSGPRR